MASSRRRISATMVASLIGKHPYQPTHDTIWELWGRWSPQTRLRVAGQRLHKSRSPLQRAFAIAAVDERLKQAIDAAAHSDGNICAKDHVQDERVAKEVEHVVAMRRGSVRETSTIDVLSRDCIISERNTKLYCKPIPGLEHVEVTGKVDGIDVANQTIIEIKNRMHRLFECVKSYEEIQCRVYMWLTGVRKVRLVEDFRGELREYMIEHDDTIWTEDILKPLVDQLQEMEQLLFHDDDTCNEFQSRIIELRKQLIYGKHGEHDTTVSDSCD